MPRVEFECCCKAIIGLLVVIGDALLANAPECVRKLVMEREEAKVIYPFLFAFLVLEKIVIAFTFIVIVLVKALHALFLFQCTWVHVLCRFFLFELFVKVGWRREAFKCRFGRRWRWFRERHVFWEEKREIFSRPVISKYGKRLYNE